MSAPTYIERRRHSLAQYDAIVDHLAARADIGTTIDVQRFCGETRLISAHADRLARAINSLRRAGLWAPRMPQAGDL